MATREELSAQYDSWYDTRELVFGYGNPNESVTKIIKYIPKGRVLDIGGGEGRDAVYLAQQGFAVTVVDLSVVGLEKLKKIAHEKELSIGTMVGDVIEDSVDSEYDVVVMSYVLHHMDTKNVRQVIENAQSRTSVGGIHTIETFMAEGGLYERNKVSGRFYPSLDALHKLYVNWDIKDLAIKETLSFARHKNGKRMKNMVAMMVAQKIK